MAFITSSCSLLARQSGAARDISGATAQAFARKGARLVLVDLPSTEASLNEKKKEPVNDGAAGVHDSL